MEAAARRSPRDRRRRRLGEVLLEVRDLRTHYSRPRLASSIGCAAASPDRWPPSTGSASICATARCFGAGRRVGLGQDHAGADPARAGRGDRRAAIKLPRRGDHRPQRGRVAPAAPAAADRLPGPARVAQPGDDDRRRDRRPAALPRDRPGTASSATRVAEALERVGLAPASQFADKYPTDLSGGQKQRAVLARAIILGPDILVADEPVSMLDMSVRAKILELMIELKRELDLTYVYITHDLATAKFFCDRIAIMYLGRIVEIGPADEDLRRPQASVHASRCCGRSPSPTRTRTVAARPAARRGARRGRRRRSAARFHPRCPRAFEVCGWESRDLRTAARGALDPDARARVPRPSAR